jgi:transcriptional regulator with XRE-family HTH domain
MSDFNDVANRLKKKVAENSALKAGGNAERAFDPEESFRLRGKMLGVLLRDARIDSQRSVDDVARYLKVDNGTIEAWEFGDDVPSLPQLELLAYFFDVPVSHFWGVKTFEAERGGRTSAQGEFHALRNRMIGALIRQTREERGMTLHTLAERAYLDPAVLNQYELGEWSIPLHELSVVSSALEKNLSFFLETASQIGGLLATRESWKHFNELPDDLRAFAANPQNIGFIEIALAFSLLSSEKLKRIAVSMLDITGY